MKVVDFKIITIEEEAVKLVNKSHAGMLENFIMGLEDVVRANVLRSLKIRFESSILTELFKQFKSQAVKKQFISMIDS